MLHIQSEDWVCGSAEPRIQKPMIGEIAGYVALKLNVDFDKMLGRRGRKPISDARHIAVWMAHGLTGKSLTQLAHYFGRDHSTIRHAIDRVDSTPSLKAIAEQIASQLTA